MDPRGLAGFRHRSGNYCQRLSEVLRRFRRKAYGLLSIAAVLGAFSALSQAVKGIDLSVAYALWGLRYCRHPGGRLDYVRAAFKQ